jgi:hypothetical protein
MSTLKRVVSTGMRGTKALIVTCGQLYSHFLLFLIFVLLTNRVDHDTSSTQIEHESAFAALESFVGKIDVH